MQNANCNVLYSRKKINCKSYVSTIYRLRCLRLKGRVKAPYVLLLHVIFTEQIKTSKPCSVMNNLLTYWFKYKVELFVSDLLTCTTCNHSS